MLRYITLVFRPVQPITSILLFLLAKAPQIGFNTFIDHFSLATKLWVVSIAFMQ